jgi:hypothetical protein
MRVERVRDFVCAWDAGNTAMEIRFQQITTYPFKI